MRARSSVLGVLFVAALACAQTGCGGAVQPVKTRAPVTAVGEWREERSIDTLPPFHPVAVQLRDGSWFAGKYLGGGLAYAPAYATRWAAAGASFSKAVPPLGADVYLKEFPDEKRLRLAGNDFDGLVTTIDGETVDPVALRYIDRIADSAGNEWRHEALVELHRRMPYMTELTFERSDGVVNLPANEIRALSFRPANPSRNRAAGDAVRVAATGVEIGWCVASFYRESPMLVVVAGMFVALYCIEADALVPGPEVPGSSYPTPRGAAPASVLGEK
jgi:hypothetical protein